MAIAMSDNSDIPCSVCRKWNADQKAFSCNPSKCEKLSEWLLDHAQPEAPQQKESVQMQVADAPIQYVV